MNSNKQFQKAVKKWRNDPVSFVEDNFGVEPFEWQKQILRDVGDKKDIAIKSGHGVGKTAVLAWCVLWFLVTHTDCRIPCTAATENQLRDTLWPEIEQWLQQSPILNQIFETTGERVQAKQAKKTWFAVARASSKPENLAGFHAENLMYIVDEASGVDDEIYEAIRGAQTNEDPIWIMASNPTRASGYFYKIFNDNWGDFERYTINSEESDNVSDDWVQKQKEDYGENSTQYRVRVLGKFPRSDDEAFIDRDLAERALVNDDEGEGREIDIGVDVAGGGKNKSVIVTRRGPEVTRIDVQTGSDTQELAISIKGWINNQIIRFSEHYRVKKKDIILNVKVDATGIGKGCADRLQEEFEDFDNVNIIPVNFGGNPYSNEGQEQYINAGTASWGAVRNRLNHDTINIPDNENGREIISQLCDRRFKLTSTGKIKLESKDRMKTRGISSPDHADACALAFFEDYESKNNFQDIKPISMTTSNRFAMEKTH